MVGMLTEKINKLSSYVIYNIYSIVIKNIVLKSIVLLEYIIVLVIYILFILYITWVDKLKIL